MQLITSHDKKDCDGKTNGYMGYSPGRYKKYALDSALGTMPAKTNYDLQNSANKLFCQNISELGNILKCLLTKNKIE